MSIFTVTAFSVISHSERVEADTPEKAAKHAEYASICSNCTSPWPNNGTWWQECNGDPFAIKVVDENDEETVVFDEQESANARLKAVEALNARLAKLLDEITQPGSVLRHADDCPRSKPGALTAPCTCGLLEYLDRVGDALATAGGER